MFFHLRVSTIPVHLLCFHSSFHLKHVNLHSLPYYINSVPLLSELHQVMVLPLFRHLLYFLALAPGACPGFYSPLYILVKGFVCQRSARAQTVKHEYGLLVRTSWYPYLESRIYQVFIT